MESRQTQRVLAILLHGPAAEYYGYQLLRMARLSSGTLYPILRRLEDRGWVGSRWAEPVAENTPRRRYYSLTAIGREATEADAQALLNLVATLDLGGSRPAAHPALDWGQDALDAA